MRQITLSDSLYDIMPQCSEHHQDIIMYIVSQKIINLTDTLEDLLRKAESSSYISALVDNIMEEVTRDKSPKDARVVSLNDEPFVKKNESIMKFIPQDTSPLNDMGVTVKQLLDGASIEDQGEMMYLLASLFCKDTIDVGHLIRKLRTLYAGPGNDPTLPQDISTPISTNTNMIGAMTPEQIHTYNMKSRAIKGMEIVKRLMEKANYPQQFLRN